MSSLTVRQILKELTDEMPLGIATSGDALDSVIGTGELSKPGLLLAGFEQGFAPERIQILGEAEFAFLLALDSDGRKQALKRLIVTPVPCIIVTDGNEPPPELIELCNSEGVPVLTTEFGSNQVVRQVGAAIDTWLSPRTSIHGTLVDVYGMGLLFTGASGIGKSECGLDLVEQGHRLVADDVVSVMRTPQDNLIGSGSDLLRYNMEIRGIGIIDVRAVYGIRAIRRQKRIEIEVRLVHWSDLDDYERLGLDEETTELLGVELPIVTLPLVPGKNITVIAEVIALNQLLKLEGTHPARELDKRLKDLAANKARVRKILRSDPE
ncbi:HPr(Ser) kinase/phosphatase [bacterium]|nr:HPr(Ser) kinase/phosphatase [bacterium]